MNAPERTFLPDLHSSAGPLRLAIHKAAPVFGVFSLFDCDANLFVDQDEGEYARLHGCGA